MSTFLIVLLAASPPRSPEVFERVLSVIGLPRVGA